MSLRMKRSLYAIQLEVNSFQVLWYLITGRVILNYSILIHCYKRRDTLFWYYFCAGVVGLQAAITEPQICKGILLLNISLRMLHIKKQPWYARPFISSFQRLLRYRWNRSFILLNRFHVQTLSRGFTIIKVYVIGIHLLENSSLKLLQRKNLWRTFYARYSSSLTLS